MIYVRVALLLASSLIGAMAMAAPVAVQVSGPTGQPAPGAIVTLTMPGVPTPTASDPYKVSQHNIAFEPHALIVPVGATVSFPNLDRVRHHVYSFSPAKKFDLKLFGRDETRWVTFEKPGVVTLGCNIHDRMNGVVYVTATPFAAVTDQNGRVSFGSVPPGRGTLTVWDPSIRRPGNSMTIAADVADRGTAMQVRLP